MMVEGKSRRDDKVPKPAYLTDPVSHTQELTGITPLHLPICVMKKHVRDTGLPPASGHHGNRIYDCHPPRRSRVVPSGAIYHDDIPIPLKHFLRHITQGQLASLVSQYGGCIAITITPTVVILLVGGKKLGSSIEPGLETHRFDAEDREATESEEGPLRILLEEESGATWIEGVPHEGVMTCTKDKQVAGCQREEDVVGLSDFRQAQLWNHRGCHVVEHGHHGGAAVLELRRDHGVGFCEWSVGRVAALCRGRGRSSRQVEDEEGGGDDADGY